MTRPSLANSMANVLCHYDRGDSVCSVVAADVNHDGRKEIVIGTFDHQVRVLSAAGMILWSVDVGGLAYAMAVAEPNKDERQEIAVVVQNQTGSVAVLEYKKGILWKFTDDLPFLSVAVGDLGGDGGKEIAVGAFLGRLYVLDARTGRVKFQKELSPEASVCALAFGDVDSRPGDELIVGTSRRGVCAFDKRGKLLWRVRARGLRKAAKTRKDKRATWHPRYKLENVQSLCVTDLTGNGRNEVVIGSTPAGSVTVLEGNGRQLWKRTFAKLMNTTSSAAVTVGNFVGDSKKELFCLLNGVVLSGQKATSPAVLLNAGGLPVGTFTPRSAFYCAVRGGKGKTGHDEMLLSSSIRGRGVSVVSFSEGRRDNLSSYQDATSKKIRDHLRKMTSAQVQEKRRPGSKKFHFLYRCNYRHIYGLEAADWNRITQPLFSIPGDNAIVLTSLYENTGRNRVSKKRRRELLDRSKIVEIAGWFEKNNIPFFLDVGKHAVLYFSAETLGKVLKTAPRSCKGFIVDENNYTRNEQWESFLPALERIMSLLAGHPGKRLIMNEYLGFWHRFPLERDKFERLFKRQYNDILVPVYKPNNIKSPELNLGVLVGLFRAGLVKNWGVGIYGDMWKWASKFYGTPADVELRLALQSISLGGTYFVFARNVSEDSTKVLDLSPSYKEYFEVLWHLIRKGVVAPIREANDMSISPLALQEAADEKEIRKRTADTWVYWQDIFRMRGLMDTGFFLQTVRDNYLPRFCYRMRNYYDGLFPRNPYGYVPIFPEAIDPVTVSGIDSYYVVSADEHLYKKMGKGLTPVSVAGLMQDMQTGRTKLPFTTPDAFVSAHRTAGGYVVYLINPLLFETRDVTASVTLNTEIGGTRITDAVSGEVLTHTKKNLSVNIPAGLFRILKIDVDQTQ
jgi:outer membrane protein assembly factor BamB